MAVTQEKAPQGMPDYSGLEPNVAKIVKPFIEETLATAGKHLTSATIVGSAATSDFRPGLSDINSVLVLDRIEMAFLGQISRMGRAHGKRGVDAPILMTPEYIDRSRDAFPLAFLAFRQNHVTIYGADPFKDLTFEKGDVRLAVEKELKGLVMNMRRGYLRSGGDRKRLGQMLMASLNAIQPAFVGLLYVNGIEAAAGKAEAITAAAKCAGISAAPFEEVIALRDMKRMPRLDALRETFRRLYETIESASRTVDRA